MKGGAGRDFHVGDIVLDDDEALCGDGAATGFLSFSVDVNRGYMRGREIKEVAAVLVFRFVEVKASTYCLMRVKVERSDLYLLFHNKQLNYSD